MRVPTVAWWRDYRTEQCPACGGHKTVLVSRENWYRWNSALTDAQSDIIEAGGEAEITCPECSGTGEVGIPVERRMFL